MSDSASTAKSVLSGDNPSPRSEPKSQRSRVRVAVRCRPFSADEAGHRCIVRMDERTTTLLDPAFFEYKEALANASDVDETQFVRRFAFDHCFWSHDSSHLQRPCSGADSVSRRAPDSAEDARHASQEKVFEEIGRPMVDSALTGISSSLFAYGQTGSGKTYTMLGDVGIRAPDRERAGNVSDEVSGRALREHAGVIPRICDNLLDRTRGMDAEIRMSFLEVYNEQLFDLLRTKESPGAARPLKIREDANKGVHAPDALCVPVNSSEEVLRLIAHGLQSRTTARTMMNDESSRSHAIFSLFIDRCSASGSDDRLISEIHLVDLAGSERMNRTGVHGEHLREANCINRSLSTLGDVIKALGQNSASSTAQGVNGKRSFVPYRNSVLTWVLKRALGGAAQTWLLAAVSPLASSYAETLTSLRFVQRAKLIVRPLSAAVSPNPSALIESLRQEIRVLKAEVAKLTTAAEQSRPSSLSEGRPTRAQAVIQPEVLLVDIDGSSLTDSTGRELQRGAETSPPATMVDARMTLPGGRTLLVEELRDKHAMLAKRVAELEGQVQTAGEQLAEAQRQACISEEVLKLKHSAELEKADERLRQAEQTISRHKREIQEMHEESQRQASESREADLSTLVQHLEHEADNVSGSPISASLSRTFLSSPSSAPSTPTHLENSDICLAQTLEESDEDEDDGMQIEESISKSLTLEKLEFNGEDAEQMLTFMRGMRSKERGLSEIHQEHEAEIATLKAEIETKDLLLSRLQGEHGSEVEALQEELAEKSKALSSMNRRVESLQGDIEEKVKKTETLQVRIDSLEEALVAKSDEKLSIMSESCHSLAKPVEQKESDAAKVSITSESLSELSAELLAHQNRETDLLKFLNEKSEELEAERLRNASLVAKLGANEEVVADAEQAQAEVLQLRARVQELVLELQMATRAAAVQAEEEKNGDEIEALRRVAREHAQVKEQLAQHQRSSENITRELVATKLELSQTLPLLEDVIDVTINLNSRIKELTKDEILPMSSGPKMLDHARSLLDKKVISRQEFVQILVNDFRVNEHQRRPETRHQSLSSIAAADIREARVHRGVPVRTPSDSVDDS